MKTIKPQRLSVLHKVFDNDAKCYFSVSVIVFFPFAQPRRLLHEVDLWKTMAAEMGDHVILDECMPKQQPEVLVNGYGYAVNGQPQATVSVRIRLANVDKSLLLSGERFWTKDGVASKPLPFTQMPLDWEHAFGGEGFERNPLGKGAVVVTDPASGMTFQPLPNIESPAMRVTSPDDRPEPAGFGYVDASWPQRTQHAGTYDNHWLKQRYPGFPIDFNWAFFNMAPRDQWLSQPLKGDEPFTIDNMHPQRPRLVSALPGIRARCFINIEAKEGLELRELIMKPETVRLFPHLERGVLIFRGTTQIREDDAADVTHLMVAAEDTETERPRSYYETVLAQRLDKDKGYLYALRDQDLLPASAFEGEPLESPTSQMAELLATDGLLGKHMRRGAEKRLDKIRADLVAQGLNPDAHGVPKELPPPAKSPDMDQLAQYVEEQLDWAEQQKHAALQKAEAAQAQARKMAEEHGLDYDAMVEKARKDAAGPPKLKAEAELQKLQVLVSNAQAKGIALPTVEAKLRDPKLFDKLKQAEERMLMTYRKFAQHFPAAARLDGEPAARIRREVQTALAANEPLAGRDLTGADLSGLDFSHRDLSGVFLEAANLSNCRFVSTNLTDAVLARADLTQADLSRATLKRTNFGAAILHQVRAVGGVDCEEAVFAKARFEDSDFSGANLHKADLAEATFLASSFHGVHARELLFLQSDLSGLTLTGASLQKCIFFEVDVQGVDFSGATLNESVFVKSRGNKALFRNAELLNFRIVQDSSFAGADFTRANLEAANLRGTNLQGSNFSEAQLESADFSECNLRKSNFWHAQAKSSMWVRADLTQANMIGIDAMLAILQKANIDGADFRDANLFRADFAKVKGNIGTNFDGANMKQVRFVAGGAHAAG